MFQDFFVTFYFLLKKIQMTIFIYNKNKFPAPFAYIIHSLHSRDI